MAREEAEIASSRGSSVHSHVDNAQAVGAMRAERNADMVRIAAEAIGLTTRAVFALAHSERPGSVRQVQWVAAKEAVANKPIAREAITRRRCCSMQQRSVAKPQWCLRP